MRSILMPVCLVIIACALNVALAQALPASAIWITYPTGVFGGMLAVIGGYNWGSRLDEQARAKKERNQ